MQICLKADFNFIQKFQKAYDKCKEFVFEK